MNAAILFIALVALKLGYSLEGHGAKNLPGTPNTITLDISKHNENEVSLLEEDEDGVSYKRFTLRDGHSISSVVESGATVWKAEENEKCTSVHLLVKSGHNNILAVYKDISGTTATNHFERMGSTWKSIKKNEFDDKLKGMKEDGKGKPSEAEGSLRATQ